MKIPVTVKVRKGWESDNVLPLLKRFEEIGVASIAIHGRTRNEVVHRRERLGSTSST